MPYFSGMKLKLLFVVGLVFFVQAASIGRAITLMKDDFRNSPGIALVIKKRFVSDLQIKKTTAEFAYLQNYTGGQRGVVYYHFKRQNNRSLWNRDFFLHLEDVTPGTYIVHARACYQMWEMFIEVR